MATNSVQSNSAAASVFAETRKQSTLPNKELGKDEFLKLLTYQMKAQNPLKPQDGTEFAAQLAQFSQLEQLTNISKLLENQSTASLLLAQTVTNSNAPSFIGKSVKATAEQINFDGTTPIDFGWEFDENQKSATVQIKTPAGAVIRTYEVSAADLRKGEHNLQWDGKNNNGESVGTGQYVVSVKATAGTGSAETSIQPYISGKITSVKFRPTGSVAVINGSEISLSNILDVSM